MRDTEDDDIRAGLGAGFATFVAKLSDTQANEAAGPLVDAISRSSDPIILWVLATALQSLPAKLSDPQANRVVEAFLTNISSARDQSNPYPLRTALAIVLAKLSDAQLSQALSGDHAKEALEALLALFKYVYNDDELSTLLPTLTKALTVVTDNLRQSDTPQAINLLAAAYASAGQNSKLVKILSEKLNSVSDKLDPLSTAVTERAVAEVLEQTLDQRLFQVYAVLSVELAKSEPADQRVINIFALLRNPLIVGGETEGSPPEVHIIGEPAKKLLAFLEKIPGIDAKFDGDLWQAVEWVERRQQEGNLKGLDLDTPTGAPRSST